MAKTWEWDQWLEGDNPNCNGRPIRVVVSRWRWHDVYYLDHYRSMRWKMSRKKNWNGWHQGTGFGPSQGRGPLLNCSHPNREGFPKLILQEGMNLHESHVHEGFRLMHDPVVVTSNWMKLDKVNKRLDPLPVWHLVIRREYKSVCFDVFVEDPQYNPKLTRRSVTFPIPILNERFDNALSTNMLVSPYGSVGTYYEINAGGVCEHCARGGDATCNLSCDEDNIQGEFEYGHPISEKDMSSIPAGVNMIKLNLPNGGYIRLPIDLVKAIVKTKNWMDVKIRPKV